MDATRYVSKARLKEILDRFEDIFGSPVCILDTDGGFCMGQADVLESEPIRRGLRLNGEYAGILVTARSAEPKEKQLNGLRLLEDQIQAAVKTDYEIDELSAEIVHSYRTLNVVYDLNTRLGDILDINAICDICLEQTLEGIPADTASLVLKAKEPESWTVFAHAGQEDGGPGKSETYQDAAMHLFSMVGEAFLCDDPLNLPKGHEGLEGSPLVSFPLVWTPLRVKENTFGFMLLARKNPEEPFLTDDLKLFQTIATCAATVIQNVRLVRDLQNSLSELQERTETIKEMQAALMSTQKMSALGQLAAAVVHDIKNPLTVISAYAQLLRSAEVQEEAPMFGEAIMEASSQISQIVTRVLDFYRQKPPEKKVEGLNELISNLLVFAEYYLSKFKLIEVERQFSEPDLKVFVDRGRIQEVFFNLIMNACHAMEEGGSLSIRTQTEILGSTPMATISFTDTGCGIPEDQLRSIFKPFMTTKQPGQGTGLGLAICQKIVREHGGEIRVDSKVDEGTTFKICLPQS
ncbi:MAG: ATP-binding protein [Planctomycetota bacterium]|jgi:signal transduction histidine kinase|nr:ATP-binding protein [Planctomycetota bacterium]MDP7249708.1 ATP-binding protein [Planctomycetota bacterium]